MSQLNISPATPTGWMCPNCRAVMAPHYPTCFYCRPKTAGTWTATGPATTGAPPIWYPPVVSGAGGSVTAPSAGTYVRSESGGRKTGLVAAIGAPYGSGIGKNFSSETGGSK